MGDNHKEHREPERRTFHGYGHKGGAGGPTQDWMDGEMGNRRLRGLRRIRGRLPPTGLPGGDRHSTAGDSLGQRGRRGR